MNPATLAEVAARAGVGYGTASRALNGRAKVSAATRAKVERAAAELGFRINPVASLLAQQRRPVPTDLVLAVVRRNPIFGQGDFEATCAGLGVTGLAVQPSEFQSPREMLRVMYTRGVHGLFVNFNGWPWSVEATVQADWSPFSVVKFGRLMPAMAFHLVRHSAFDYLHAALEQVLRRGYRKVAVLLFDSGSEIDDRARLGATLAAAEVWRAKGRTVQWYRWSGASLDRPDAAVLKRLRKDKPDALLVYQASQVYLLAEAGWEFPRDAGLAAVVVDASVREPNTGGRISGNAQALTESVSRAFRLLKDQIGRNERGVPRIATESVIEPRWIEGDTLPRRAKGAE